MAAGRYEWSSTKKASRRTLLVAYGVGSIVGTRADAIEVDSPLVAANLILFIDLVGLGFKRSDGIVVLTALGTDLLRNFRIVFIEFVGISSLQHRGCSRVNVFIELKRIGRFTGAGRALFARSEADSDHSNDSE